MAPDIFKRKFRKDPKEFDTIKEVNDFVEEKIGRKLEVEDFSPEEIERKDRVLKSISTFMGNKKKA